MTSLQNCELTKLVFSAFLFLRVVGSSRELRMTTFDLLSIPEPSEEVTPRGLDLCETALPEVGSLFLLPSQL